MSDRTQHDPLQSRLERALSAAETAGRITLEYFARSGLLVETKGDGSPVTVADRAAETAIREHLASAFPGDALEGEEHARVEGDTGYNWIIDPIDGTYSFVHGVPLYGTLIGLEYDGRMVAGVMHMPALGETVYAAVGRGAWHRTGGGQPVPARVSRTASVGEALVSMTSYHYFQASGTTGTFERINNAAGHLRGWSDCYAAVLVATGRADAMVEPVMFPWDAAALWPVIAEAGGRCSDWSGSDTIRGGNCVVSNGLIHDELLDLTRGRGG